MGIEIHDASPVTPPQAPKRSLSRVVSIKLPEEEADTAQPIRAPSLRRALSRAPSLARCVATTYICRYFSVKTSLA